MRPRAIPVAVLLASAPLAGPASAAETASVRRITADATTVLKDGGPEAFDAVEGKAVSIILDARGGSLVRINDPNNAVARFTGRHDDRRSGIVACTRPDGSLRLNRRTGVMLRSVTTPGASTSCSPAS
ncbi:hypothetical protein [Methylobacterium planeticum]|uniref:Uncharacterized protein n=1 Tax=Methylobacterium planeticum TaxID=2615211 RepID=A0A6N6MNV0_9HYPH|nr:hypothetical protein [Methylobacterium planeticum]KAB1073163.1 hypothetical protein F6X51_12465 [Methylobacterium planeticum]